MADLIYKDEVYKIVGAAMEVHKVLGTGFLEAVYQEALTIEFKFREILFVEFPKVEINYKEFKLEKYYIPDFLCFDKIVVEIKAISKCTPNDEAQIINAIKSSKMRVGILFNFGESSLYWQRYVN
jgi:GxxExxY protein